jgi:hypothetical protein
MTAPPTDYALDRLGDGGARPDQSEPQIIWSGASSSNKQGRQQAGPEAASTGGGGCRSALMPPAPDRSRRLRVSAGLVRARVAHKLQPATVTLGQDNGARVNTLTRPPRPR